jgi:hypothetical protein
MEAVRQREELQWVQASLRFHRGSQAGIVDWVLDGGGSWPTVLLVVEGQCTGNRELRAVLDQIVSWNVPLWSFSGGSMPLATSSSLAWSCSLRCWWRPAVRTASSEVRGMCLDSVGGRVDGRVADASQSHRDRPQLDGVQEDRRAFHTALVWGETPVQDRHIP